MTHDNQTTRRSGPALRVGGIDYLNAQPLLYSLDAGALPLELSHEVPSALATGLREGRLDVALIPVVAYAESPEYRVVPGVGISSYGAVLSIRLYHRRPLGAVRRVALDSCSRTSALLTRLLYSEAWGGEPEFFARPPDTLHAALAGRDADSADFDAALLIGDSALEAGVFPGWEEVDLGTEWTRWTGLPFVYAFWVCRPPRPGLSLPPGLVEEFQRARDLGVARIDEIVERATLPEGFSASDGRHYLSRVIQFDLGDDKLEGLEFFFDGLRRTGLLDAPGGPLRFLDVKPSAVQTR